MVLMLARLRLGKSLLVDERALQVFYELSAITKLRDHQYLKTMAWRYLHVADGRYYYRIWSGHEC
jgi:hypothetical protein